MPRTPPPQMRRCRGFGVVELLVALGVGLALTLAITLVTMRHDGERRALTSTNDAQLNANYVGYLLDRTLRSAGSGFAQGWRSSYGCLLHAARGGAQVLPRTGSFPTPFTAVTSQLRLAPVVIHAGAGAGGSDVLAIALGSSGTGETSPAILPGSISAASLSLPATVGIRGNDLLLVAEPGLSCMVQQVAAPFTGGATQALALGGTYTGNPIAGTDITAYSGAATVSVLGNTAGNPPMFLLLGLGANDMLMSYDLLRLDGGDTPRPMADGIAELRALYGVDTNGDGVLDNWVAPTAAGYTAAALQDGSPAARDRLVSIMAIRLGLVLRADRIERENVAPSTLTLFGEMGSGLQRTVTLDSDAQRRRHRVLELTVPLRNNIHQIRS